MTGKIAWGGWRKAARTELIQSHNIRYSNHKVGEEAIFSFMLLYFAKTVAFIDVPVYNYELHLGSLSQTPLDDPWGDVAMALKRKVQEMNLYDQYSDTMNAFICTATAVSLNQLARRYDSGSYNKKAFERIDRMKADIDANSRIDYRHIDKRALLLFPLLRYRMITLIRFISKLADIVD